MCLTIHLEKVLLRDRLSLLIEQLVTPSPKLLLHWTENYNIEALVNVSGMSWIA
jgi:hypothetical protein